MFLSLDFLYIPSQNPGREIGYYTDVLGGTLLFRNKAMGHGPCCAFTAEGGQRLAIYELTRPEANEDFLGRFDKRGPR